MPSRKAVKRKQTGQVEEGTKKQPRLLNFKELIDFLLLGEPPGEPMLPERCLQYVNRWLSLQGDHQEDQFQIFHTFPDSLRFVMENCGISHEHTQFEANKAGILGGVENPTLLRRGGPHELRRGSGRVSQVHDRLPPASSRFSRSAAPAGRIRWRNDPVHRLPHQRRWHR